MSFKGGKAKAELQKRVLIQNLKSRRYLSLLCLSHGLLLAEDEKEKKEAWEA